MTKPNRIIDSLPADIKDNVLTYLLQNEKLNAIRSVRLSGIPLRMSKDIVEKIMEEEGL